MISLLACRAPTILFWMNTGLIILEHDIIVNTATLRHHKVLGLHHHTECISNTCQFRLCEATGVHILLP